MHIWYRTWSAAVAFCLALVGAPQADAFCGFYLAKADADLFNAASKVVIARDSDRTTITMANDYRGDPREFALVVPVPTVLDREQIRVRGSELIDRIDAYTAPRLVEYPEIGNCVSDLPAPVATPAAESSVNSYGVTVEAEYTVGEYDIVILSAEQSDGLEEWLVAAGYRIPQGAAGALARYIAAGTKFFVARIDLAITDGQAPGFLQPLQISFRSKRFMLPIQLGMLNASGPQELLIFTLTRNGRVQTTNYATVSIPSNLALPRFVKDDFGAFYKSMFERSVLNSGMRAVFLEYAWDMNWCDPCAADPLSVNELHALGADWVSVDDAEGQGRQAFVTRLHVRYDKERFPEDLEFEETDDRTNFQGRYIVTRPADPNLCPSDEGIKAELEAQRLQEAANLAGITTWGMTLILERMNQVK